MNLNEMIGLTADRQTGFQLMVNHLRQHDNPVIVETGCARWENNWAGDGMSTLIFDRYINDYNGSFYSVDNNEGNVAFAKTKISPRTDLVVEDSVARLHKLAQQLRQQNRTITLLYLDSYDLDHGHPYPSASHHLQELAAVLSVLDNKTLIGVDDNYGTPQKRMGKGMYIADYMRAIGIPVYHESVQLFWRYR